MSLHPLHTDDEMKAIPSAHTHLRKDGKVIHKSAKSFLPRTKTKAVMDAATELQKVNEKGAPLYETITYPPACNLKTDYLDKGWVECKEDGSDRPGPKPGAKQTAADKKVEKEAADKTDADAKELADLKADKQRLETEAKEREQQEKSDADDRAKAETERLEAEKSEREKIESELAAEKTKVADLETAAKKSETGGN